MSQVKVRLFGVYRMDTHIAQTQLSADNMSDVMKGLSAMAVGEHKSSIAFTDATVYVNGERCKKKKQKLNDGDEIWLLSPASGG